MLTQKEFMDDIEKNAFGSLKEKILNSQSEQEKLNLKNILNTTTELGITPFARAVHKLPQNQADWSIIIINMIMAGADVTATYPNSHYTVLERLNLYAEVDFFKELSSYLFANALSEGKMRLLYSLIARNPYLIERIRYSYKKEFYIALLQQISLLPDSTELNYLSFTDESFVNNKFVPQPQFVIEKKATFLIDLINFINPTQSHNTVEKRKWYYLVLALKGRALCIANRKPLYNQTNISFFKQLFKDRINLFLNIDQYFIQSMLSLETPGLNDVLEKSYHVDLSSDIEKQKKLLLSPLRIAVMLLLKAHRTKIEQQNKIKVTEKVSENNTEILNKDEIDCIEKILSLTNTNKGSILSLFDEKIFSQVKKLIDIYYEQLKSDHITNTSSANQIQNTNIAISEAQYKALYAKNLGLLPSTLPANINSYKELYTLVKNTFFDLETMESKFKYAILHNLTVCMNNLIQNYYFALEESWIQQALFDAVSQKKIEIISAIVEAKPILVFWMTDPVKGSFWEYLISLINDNNLINIAISVMNILKKSFKIPGETLLPFASLFGIVEIIDALLYTYEDQLLANNDLLLSFEYALQYHHYDIIIKLINDNIYFSSIKQSIDIESFAKSLQFAMYDISDIEGLKYFYHLITVDFEKVFILDQPLIPSSLITQTYQSYENTQNMWWPTLIISLKSRANSLLKNATHKYHDNEIFIKIDKLFSKLGLEHNFYSVREQTHIASYNTSLQYSVPLELKHILTNDPNAELTETNPQVYLQLIFKYINHYESELILQLIQQLNRCLLYRSNYKLCANDKEKVLQNIDDVINNIKNGKIKWIAILDQLIKFAVKMNCLSSKNSNEITATIRYLLSDQEFKHISHYLLHVKNKLSFKTETTTQEILKISAPTLQSTDLDPNKKLLTQLNDISLIPRSTQTKFALQMANLNDQAKLRDIHKPRWISSVKWKKIYNDFMADYQIINQSSKKYFNDYRELMKEFIKNNPKNKLLYAVKLNKNKWVELLLEDVSHSYDEWDNDTKNAFTVALANNKFSHCAKSFIEHLDPKYWEILVKSTNNQLSLIQIAENNDNSIVQLAILNKILSSSFFPKYYTLLHLAVLFELPNTLRNCITINHNKIDIQISGSTSLTSFESAIQKKFFAGIFCFIEQGDNSLASLRQQYLEELCVQYSRLIMKTQDLNQFEKMINHLALIIQYYTSNKNKFTTNITIRYGLLKFACLLTTLKMSHDHLFSQELTVRILNSIDFNLPLPIFAKYYKQLQLKVHNKLTAKQNGLSFSNTTTEMENEFEIQMSEAIPSKQNNMNNSIATLSQENIAYFNYGNILYTFIDALLNDNKMNIYIFISRLVKNSYQKSSHIAEAYIIAINCAVEFNLLTIFKELLQCLLETFHQSPLITDILQTCVEYILSHRRYIYLEHILNEKVGGQLNIKLINLNLFRLAISDEIENSNDINDLINIYNKINSIYKPFLTMNSHDSFKLFIQQIINKFSFVSEKSQTKIKDLERIKAILWTGHNGSNIFYQCLLNCINHCKNQNDVEYIDNQLQQWLQFLSTNQTLNPLHLLLSIQTRITIYEKMCNFMYKQPRESLVESYVDFSKFPCIQLPINGIQSITFCNEKLRLLSFRKTNCDDCINETTQLSHDNSYLFYSNIIDKNSFTLLEAVITLAPITDICQEILNSEQERICGTIDSLLAQNTKISYQFYHKLKSLLPILTLYKTSLFISNNLKPAKSVSKSDIESTKSINPLDIEFEICNMTKSINENSFSELDRALDTLVTTKMTEDEYLSLLDKIISYMNDDYEMHPTSVPIVQNIWQSLLDRIEQKMTNLVTGALIPKYVNTHIYINENLADEDWLDRFNKEFGNAPINSKNEQYFYQKLYKTTLLEYHYLTDIKDQFDYCITNQLLYKLEQLVKSSLSSLSYAQLHAAFVTALDLKAIHLIIFILPHLDPFDIFNLQYKQSKSYWQIINEYPDQEFTSIASVILNNIKNYLLIDQVSLTTLSICFDMRRMTLNLLKFTSTLTETDIKSAFQTAIYCRNYQCVSVLIDNYYQKYQNAFKINKNHFYRYLYDELALCLTKEDIQLFRTRLNKQYVLIKEQFPKSSFFAAKDNDWQSIIDNTELTRREIDNLQSQLNSITNHNKTRI